MATEQGAAAARDLPKAEALVSGLYAFAEAQAWEDPAEPVDDYFRITRIEPGRIWFTGTDGRERGPIPLPEELTRQCTVGWAVSGAIGRVDQHWQLLEAWNVYPL